MITIKFYSLENVKAVQPTVASAFSILYLAKRAAKPIPSISAAAIIIAV